MSAELRIAVTGAGGYLGRPLVGALARDERVASVLALDLRPPPPGDRIEPRVRDVRDPALAADLEGADALVHLAFVVLGRGRGASSVNVDGSRNAFDCALAAGVRTILYTSSAAAYGCTADNPVPLTEESPLRPLPPFYYPQTKVAVERVLDAYEERARVVRLRPIAILGPRAPLMFGGRVFLTLSDFDPPMQFAWIDDFVDLALRALLDGEARGAFNVGAPGPVRASEVPALLGVRGIRAPYRVLRAAARLGRVVPGAGVHPAWVDMARYPIVVSTARAERELGWQPKYDCAGALLRFGDLLERRRPMEVAA
jgi:nucleoside-diphosphate-sugar epimerase